MEQKTIRRKEPEDRVIALVGNPNVGKSTVFNALTGLRQHTGNWPGKTVEIAQGRYEYKGKGYVLVDLPGTYSLQSQSEEERLAAEFIRSGQAECTVVLADAACLERNLILALQVMALTDRVILCVNLLDEAERHHIHPDLKLLERRLGIPVTGTAASDRRGLPELQETIRSLADGFRASHPRQLAAGEDYVRLAKELAAETVGRPQKPEPEPLDRIVLGRWTGRLVMLGLLLAVFWLTIQGANYPSALLAQWFERLGLWLGARMTAWPAWLSGLLVEGIYGTSADVIAVMLPPMAIFFPLFTLLEDFGYLPRAAFLMDRSFEKCGGCGKQVLTMAMGFGCNAAGVTGCRIITSPRERLLAILTNALVPCNGRFPILITLIGLFFTDSSLVAAMLLTGCLLLSVAMTFVCGRLLSGTILRGQPSDFILELPPYRRPKILRVLVRSLLDRTVVVLGRAVMVAAPAGAVLWLLQNVTVGSEPLLNLLAALLNPVGLWLGMNGAILLAFLLAFPANELVLPLVLTITGAGTLPQLGWTWQTALCVILFTLFHWPCSTTCLTIRKETGSWRWTLAAIALPTLIGVLLCAVAALIFQHT